MTIAGVLLLAVIDSINPSAIVVTLYLLSMAGSRAQRRLAEPYAALGQRLERGARETMLWMAGLVGGGLLVTGMIELVARLR